MKKNLSILLLGILFSAGIYAQGVSRLFGLVGGGPQANQSSNGFLFSTDSSGNGLQEHYKFPVTVFGANPQNLEMVQWNGKLYGTTSRGGLNDYGTIFEYDPATNTYTKKFDFGPNVSLTGGGPKGSLLLYNNKFYGLAADYGVSGAGCLFEWDPATNVYTKKFDFGGSYPGAYPQNSLRLMNGKMYGTTQQGGSSNLGIVFEWDPVANTSRMLFELNGTNGWGFYNNVTPYNNKLYVASHQGGASGYGALYSIDPALPTGSNTTIIKMLDATSGGSANNNEMIVYNNKLYGCLNQAGNNFGGTLFELDPATNTFTKLFNFDYTASGDQPLGKLVQNGATFIGLCGRGGTNGTGTVYEWDPANPTTVVKKYSFGPNNFNNPINAGSTLAAFGSKFYAVSYNGGFVNQGTLFEYDPATSTATKKLTFNAAENGRIPYGRPVLLNGQLYGTCQQGPQEIFGSAYGCLWSYDPQTNTYSRKFIFDNTNNAANGRNPTSSPMTYNGKLYGVTVNGGTSDFGVLYEYDPVTSGYLKKDMQPIGGAFPIGEPTLYNNKLYGMTNANGIGNNGIIYSYDPATGTLAKLYDVQNSGGTAPSGGFAVYNNKLYGTTSGGGANNSGTIFTYDPATNTATTVYNLLGSTGVSIANPMTLFNNKFYGTAFNGGTGGRGVIFEFDPATNVYTVKHNFSTATGGTGYDPKGELTVNGNKLYCITQEGNGIVKVVEFDPVSGTAVPKSTYNVTNFNVPVTHNGLTVVPAFIAPGIPNSCESYPSITIDGTNNNKWVPVLNPAGDVVAEIKANGNNLGTVSVSAYINSGTVREDSAKRMYLDRNITITPQNRITGSSVDLRLYIKTAEFLALKNATNSAGQPSGISTINDVAIFKNQQTCNANITQYAPRLATTTSAYEYGYVLSTSVDSFSTFYFAKATLAALPVTLTSFTATKHEHSVQLNWTSENETNMARYEIERSATGAVFSNLNNVAARNSGRRSDYVLTDNHPFSGDNYYRLKIVDRNGQVTYSNIIKVNFSGTVKPSLQPNPATDRVFLNGLNGYRQVQVLDITGRVQLQQAVRNTSEQLDINRLAKGIYTVQLTGNGEPVLLRLVKQ